MHLSKSINKHETTYALTKDRERFNGLNINRALVKLLTTVTEKTVSKKNKK